MLRLTRISDKKIIMLLVIFLLFFSVLDISTMANGEDRPDLTINYVDLPDKIIDNENLKFIIKIKNEGKKNITTGTIIGVALKIDGLIVTTNSSSKGLNSGSTVFINISWTPSLIDVGFHLLSIIVDYQEIIIESDENNNFWDAYVEVLEKDTDIEILSIIPQDDILLNETAIIYSTIKNNGKASTKPIYAKLNSSEQGTVETLIKKDSLARGKTYTFSFNWTPSHFGSQKIGVDIIYENKSHDYKEISVVVGIYQLQWWDVSWHYRHFLTVNGSGNISKFFNFTKILKDIGVLNQQFENDTIRIIEYRKNGTIIGEINKYKFNESAGFDPVDNATGTLIWNVSGISLEKYYCIYFDVLINTGARSELVETDTIHSSGNAVIGNYNLTQGWWVEIIQPINNSYTIVDNPVNITVSTKAKAKYVKAYIFLNNNESHNFTVDLIDVSEKILWKKTNFYFDLEGNWTIRIFSGDWTSYMPDIEEHAFYVGKPDVELISINFTTDWSYTSPSIYKNDTVNITANIVAHNATVENVYVYLSIFDIKNNIEVYNEIIIKTIFKDKNNQVSFDWKAIKSGKFNVTIILDPYDIIDEQNESNNKLIKKIDVYDWPDLEIKNIILPSIEITEFDKVNIETVIFNGGEGDATDYEARLYLEKAAQGIMTYTNLIDSQLFTAKKNTSATVTFSWNSSLPGEWLVGVKVIVTDTKRDTNIENNRLLLNGTLKVKAIETNKPLIFNVNVVPTSLEQGGTVKITAEITDDSGLESVDIIITNPLETSYNQSMVRTNGNEFRCTFDKTLAVGKYNFKIDAVDVSLHHNKALKDGDFLIFEDRTSPVISFYEADPNVQLIDENVEISCVVSDNIGLKTVKVSIIPPSGSSYEKTMEWSPKGKYVYKSIYSTPGEYTFYIRAEDEAGNTKPSEYKTFWITSDLSDTDNDGIPDEWEENYNLDPKNPNDGKNDSDGDGLTNIEEYTAGNNPRKDIFAENAVYRIKNNIWYLSASVAIFIFIALLIIIKRRKST